MSGDIFVISGLPEKRSAAAGQIFELHRQLDRLQADLFHVDAVLRLCGAEPSEIPTRGRMPVRSDETRRIHDAPRAGGKEVDIAMQPMRHKQLALKANKKVRVHFASASLHRCMTRGGLALSSASARAGRMLASQRARR